MNRRMKIKRLKSQNKLMRDIIHDSTDMERVYHLWTDGLEIKHTTIPIEEYKCERIIPYGFIHNDKYIEHATREVIRDLCNGLEDYVSIETRDLGWEKVIHGSIFVGKVRHE